jgi:pimeloyl-ACP methyl ester carboxylesterase
MPDKKPKKKLFIWLVCFSAVFVIGIVVAGLFIFQGSSEFVITENHPFKSAEAKEQWIRYQNEREKMIWPANSDSVYVNTSFGKTFVRICGQESAPPLVLLHAGRSDSLMWSASIGPFSEKYRTYAVDTIGDCGLSVNTKLLKGANDYCQWLDELFTGLHLNDNINLLGMSFGGWIAGQYALGHQDRLNKVVLLSPAGIVLPLCKQFYARAMLAALPIKYCRNNILLWLCEDQKKQDEELFKKTTLYHSDIIQQCFKSSPMTTIPTMLSDQQLQSLKVPVLFLTGANEKVYSPTKATERLEKVAPSIQKEIISGGGHDLISVKNDLVNTKVLKFLSSIGNDN